MSSHPGYPVQGGCLCGAVRFELAEPPQGAGYCHCGRCQRRTGTAASPSAWAAASALRWLSGEELVRGWRHPEGGGEKCFCVNCGAHLISRMPDGETLAIRMSAFDVAPDVQFSYRQYVAFAAPWEPIPDDGLPRHEHARSR